MKIINLRTRLNSAVATCAITLSILSIDQVAAQSIALEEIVVTARKREENLLEIPVSITAFTQDDLDRAGINNLEDLSAISPGFQFLGGANGGAGRGNEAVRFRGLTLRAADPSNRPGAVFWDGGYLSHGSGILPIIDVERVEVIKGPQTAFFGRNTFSGAVNFIPREPGDEFSGKISTSYSWSNKSSYNFTAAAGGPVSETFGLRVAATYNKEGADWEFRNGEPQGGEEDLGGTIVATWQPTESLRIKATGVLVNAEDGHQFQSQFARNEPGSCNVTYSGEFARLDDRSITRPYSTDLSQDGRRLFCGEIPDWDAVPMEMTAFSRLEDDSPLFLGFLNNRQNISELPDELAGVGIIPSLRDDWGSKYNFWRANLSADYDMPNEHTLSFLYSIGESASRGLFDGRHGSTTDPFATSLIRAIRDNYGEVRIASGSDNRLRYQAGFSYYDQDNRQGFIVGTWRVLNRTAKTFGVFGSVDYDITERLTASLEGRWHDDKLIIDFNGVSGTSADTNPATVEDEEQSYDAFMPRIILSYEAIDNLNVYASWSESRLQGVPTLAQEFLADTGIDLGLGIFTPTQKNTTYEVGLKNSTEWINYSIALYYTEWKNQVFSEGAFRTPPLTGLANANIAGDTEVKGVDIEFAATPTDWISVTGGLSYNDVEFVDYAATGSITGILTAGADPARVRSGPEAELITVAGNRPRHTPKWTANVSTTFFLNSLLNIERDAWLRVDGNYHGNFFLNAMNFNKVDGYWKFNLRAGGNITDDIAIEFYADNLTNDLSWVANGGTTSGGLGGGANRRTFGPLPTKREIGLRLTSDF